MWGDNRIIAVIGARGGSKGLPGKNIRPLHGKPLIAWTIEAALQAESVDKVVVSTDSTEIQKVALDYGAECPFLRPDTLASDEASSEGFLSHALEHYQASGESFETLINLQPTSPLRTSTHLNAAISQYFTTRSSPLEALVSVYEAPQKVQWLLKPDEDGFIDFCFKQGEGALRRQLAPTYYLPNGAIYIYPASHINDGLYSKRTQPFVMNADDSVDIDTLEDFERASTLVIGSPSSREEGK